MSLCVHHLQAEYLKHMYVLGINVARERMAGSEADVAVAGAAMDLMCVILEWDWRPSDMPSAAAQRMVADAAQARHSMLAGMRHRHVCMTVPLDAPLS